MASGETEAQRSCREPGAAASSLPALQPSGCSPLAMAVRQGLLPPGLGVTGMHLGRHGSSGAVGSHRWAAAELSTFLPALTCDHSADPIAKMSQWIHLLKVLVVQAHERDAQEILQR